MRAFMLWSDIPPAYRKSWDTHPAETWWAGRPDQSKRCRAATYYKNGRYYRCRAHSAQGWTICAAHTGQSISQAEPDPRYAAPPCGLCGRG